MFVHVIGLYIGTGRCRTGIVMALIWQTLINSRTSYTNVLFYRPTFWKSDNSGFIREISSRLPSPARNAIIHIGICSFLSPWLQLCAFVTFQQFAIIFFKVANTERMCSPYKWMLQSERTMCRIIFLPAPADVSWLRLEWTAINLVFSRVCIPVTTTLQFELVKNECWCFCWRHTYQYSYVEIFSRSPRIRWFI